MVGPYEGVELKLRAS